MYYYSSNMIMCLVFLTVLVRTSSCTSTAQCGRKELAGSYLQIAVDMITKARINMPECSGKSLDRQPMDCTDLLQMGHNESGVYTIWPMNRLTEDKSIDVYCDMDTAGGGWTIIQRRGNFQRSADFFFKAWESYKGGFGDIQKDFWLGNDNIFALSNQKLHSARFDLKDVESNKRYAQYDTFWIDDEINKYTLHISDYSGDAGDSMTEHHNNQKFSTNDQDNDNDNKQCASNFKGGWWYNKCHHSNLNGLYLKGKHESFADGINWKTWKGYKESLESTEIKIRPKNFKATFEFLNMTPQ